MRGSDGVLVVGTPTADNHAATKKYVDDIIEANPTATGTETQLERIKIKGTNYSVGGGGKLYRHSLMIHMQLYDKSTGPTWSDQYVLYVMYSTSSTPMTNTDFATYLGSVGCAMSTYPTTNFPKQGPSFVFVNVGTSSCIYGSIVKDAGTNNLYTVYCVVDSDGVRITSGGISTLLPLTDTVTEV